MKQFSLTFLCALLFLSAEAQSYIPFPVSGALWTQRQGMREATPEFSCYGLKGDDTTIGLVTYHKLYHSSDSVLDASEYCGGLREDGAKRIFYYDDHTKKERLLYDFSIKTGDAVDVGMSYKVEVGRIDSILIDGVYHKRFNFIAPGGTEWTLGSWVEGMGNSNTGGLLGSVMAQPTCDCAVNLVCFKERNTYVYHNTKYLSLDCFGNSLSIPETGKTREYPLAPNPVTGSSWIWVTDFSGKVTIFNTTGVALFTAPLSPQQPLLISNTMFPAGMYYYRLTDAQQVPHYTGKFLVQ